MRRIASILLGCLAASPAMAVQSSSADSFIQTAEQTGRTSAAPLLAEGRESAEASLASDIERRVSTDWPKYDAADDGYLAPDEFSRWMNDLRGENGNGPADEAIMRAAFLVADTDKDTSISREELTAFMMSRNGVKRPANG